MGTRKNRSDSTIGGLPADVRETIEEMLLSGSSYKKVATYLADDHGIDLSITSISQYYRTQILPAEMRRKELAASVISSMDTEGLEAAATASVRMATFDLATMPDKDPKKISALYSLVLRAKKMELDARKIAYLEERARKADEAKSILEKSAGKGGLTPETRAEIEEAIGLL